MNINDDIHDAMAHLMWHIEHAGPQPVIDMIEEWEREPDSEGQPWHYFLADGVKNAVRQAHPLQSGRTIISIRYPEDSFEAEFEFAPKESGSSEYNDTVIAAVTRALTGSKQ